jgi:hypothetical protein
MRFQNIKYLQNVKRASSPSKPCCCKANQPKRVTLIKKLLNGAVKEAMCAKEFDVAERSRLAFDIVSDLDHALNKEMLLVRPTELDIICKDAPWKEECRVYDI